MTSTRFAFALCLFAALIPHALAQTERPGKLTQVEYVYETGPEIGPVRVGFTWNIRPYVLNVQVSCKLFESDVPPGNTAVAALSISGHKLSWSPPIDPETGETSDPELWLSVPLLGRAGGDPGHHTHVVFHFDHEGNITRSLKREYYRPEHWKGLTIRVDWPIHSQNTPDEVLNAAYAERERNQQIPNGQVPAASN